VIFAFDTDPVRIAKGAIAGFLISSIISIFEHFVFQSKFKKLKFSTGLIIRTIVYVIVISFAIIVVWVVHESSVNSAGILLC
jgi:hypothetical protein